MRKNKLYNRRDINIFASGGGWTDLGWYTPEYKMTSGGGVAIDENGNPIYEGSHLSTAGGLALGATAANGILSGLAGENETGVGNALKGIGLTAAVLPGPYGRLVKVGLESTGNLLNAAFGSNIDEAKVAEIKNRAINQATQEFSHSSNEDLLALNQSMTMLGDVSRGDVGSDGWFANKAKKKARELSYLNQEANKSMVNNFGNAVDTVALNNFFRSIDTGNNILAFGGNIFDDGGSVFKNNLQRFKLELALIPGKVEKFLHTKPLEKPLKNLGNKVKYYANRRNFKGGFFGGSGAGGTFTLTTPGEVESFNDAFDRAYARGDSTFYFRGNEYTTKKELNPYKELNNREVGELRKSNLAPIYDILYGSLHGEPFNIRLVSNYWANGGNMFGTGGDTMTKRAAPIYQRFIDAGISPIAASGVLGNMALESSLNPKASNKTHWGYLLNDSTIHDHLKKYYNGDSHESQMQFIIDGLLGKLKGNNTSVGKMIQSRFNRYNKAVKDSVDPLYAAEMWDKYYEISGGQALNKRKNYAHTFFKAFNNYTPEPLIEKPDITRTNISPVIAPIYVGPKKILMPVFDSFLEGEEPAVSTNVLTLPTLDQVYRGLYPQGGLGDYLYNKDNRGGMITPAQFLDMIHSKKFGGELQTLGAEFPGMMTYIENGGTHEENPLGGIPVGVDPLGTPNLVEEGETIFNDYVFSNRLEVPKEVKKVLGLRGKKKYTFAEASKYLNKEAEERPNDQISENGLEDSLSKLMGILEIVKQNNELNIMAEGGNIHIAENKKGTFTAAATRHHMGVLEFANKVLANKDNYSPAMVKKANFARNASKWHALGGNLYWDGSELDNYNYGNNDLYYDTNRLVNAFGEAPWVATNPGNTDHTYVSLGDAREAEKARAPFLNDLIKDIKLNAENPTNAPAIPGSMLVKWMQDYDKGIPSESPGAFFYPKGKLRDDYLQLVVKIGTDGKTGPGHNSYPKIGKRYYVKDANGNRVYKKAPEDLSKYIIGDPTLDGVWTDYEIKGLADGVTPQVVPSPDDTGVLTEEAIINTNQEPLRDYPEYLRYAPTVLSGLGVLTDTLGLTNRPDYTLSRGLSNLAGNTRYRPISYTPVGEYLTYKPVDTVKQAIDLRAAHLAVARNLMNISGGNRGTLAAGLLANNYQDVINSGNAIFNANLGNRKTEEGVGTFNRGTDTTNALGSLSALQANQNAYMSAQLLRNALYAAALEAREKERALSFANRNANLLQFTNNLGEIGRENWAQNRLNWLIRNGYYRRYNDAISTPTKKQSKESKTREVKEPVYYTNFAEWASNRMNGGKLNRKKNK